MPSASHLRHKAFSSFVVKYSVTLQAVESETLKLLNRSLVGLFVVNVNISQFEVQGRDEQEDVDRHVPLRMSSGTFIVVAFYHQNTFTVRRRRLIGDSTFIRGIFQLRIEFFTHLSWQPEC